jgi:predicted amidohydrolase YtcJ
MEHADIIITNGSVRTMAPGAERPSATTVAVRGTKIAAVGGSEVLELRGPATRLCDAGGATVLPGFVEAHMHLFSGAYGRRLLQLFDVRGQEALTGAVRAYAAAHPSEGLLIAKGTDYTILGDRPITRQALDEILPDRPLILIAPDHHTAWANTVALERAGILHGRRLSRGNAIVLDADGLASGELQEIEAISPVMALRTSGGREGLGLAGTEPGPDLTAAQRAEDIETIKAGLRYCASHGITSVHNMDGNRYQLDLLRRIEADGDLLCRTQIPFHLTPAKPLESVAQASELDREFRTDMLRSGRVKMFMDGVVDSGTAVLLEDYADTPGWRGEPLHSQDRFNAAAIEIDRRGLQISVHAIGDGAVRMVLDGYQAARAANGARDSRHRIEHIEVLHPDDLPRFAELGVVASMQPPHPPGSMGLPLHPYLSKIGRSRWPSAFVWRDLWAAGARIAFASDWPVSAVEPMKGIHAAVTRKPWAPGMPDPSATLEQALAGYTREGAHAGHSEQLVGMLRPGMQADIAVLSGCLEDTDLDSLHEVGVAVTFCGGCATHGADRIAAA